MPRLRGPDALARSQFCPPHVELALLLGMQSAHRDGHARGGLGDVDAVVEVAAEGNRKLVEQQVLRAKLGVFGQPVEGRVRRRACFC